VSIAGEKHFGNPSVAPVKLFLTFFWVNQRLYGMKVGAATLAEPQFVALAGTTSRTEHDGFSYCHLNSKYEQPAVRVQLWSALGPFRLFGWF
jgi:hypothetical protein